MPWGSVCLFGSRSFIEDVDEYLRSRMSPVRTVCIGPMLAERSAREVGWCRVPVDSEEWVRDPELSALIRRFQEEYAGSARWNGTGRSGYSCRGVRHFFWARREMKRKRMVE
ncbi:hypothetical protein M5W83_15585 [Paenibacillus thiaminolyticus]|uniref:Uncharacterized protein n=1 Tax=Paenibacillus thiaminolyticus TaxID=49283 RepID=A0AAP9DWM1_PANTH|nr:hypothetical protein [Paenibacillus thiaminolyticus]MCY9535874.1 hypothetical protein [Paenibacillus thiaminolyticus]MCY9605007.1 hypothetical protein [Paenibacillus thiaminolyticus]MCY9608567.1 hypothetical protein [Paenibacillus thiaminolyticus]MCY9615626.1 hypothetical protein [Paenibacillus thiaminolyticus]MCY9622233.1 hypothetical protein [Paenibacillus thiaminolyticus]